MRIGVIGGSGKTVLSLLLCNLFPEVTLKPKSSSYFSNVSIEPLLTREKFSSDELKTEKNITILMSMLDAGELTAENISDYAYIAHGTKSNIFESINQSLTGYESIDILTKVMDMVKNHFTIVDIQGDYSDIYNKQILDKCDCVLYCFNPNQKSCKTVKHFNESILPENRNRYKFICTKMVPYISRRDLQKLTSIRNEEVIFVPHLELLEKHDFYGALNDLNKKILKGDKETLELKKALASIFNWVYGKGVIKEVGKW